MVETHTYLPAVPKNLGICITEAERKSAVHVTYEQSKIGRNIPLNLYNDFTLKRCAEARRSA